MVILVDRQFFCIMGSSLNVAGTVTRKQNSPWDRQLHVTAE